MARNSEIPAGNDGFPFDLGGLWQSWLLVEAQAGQEQTLQQKALKKIYEVGQGIDELLELIRAAQK